MFTGIVEETGSVVRVQKGAHSAVLTVQARKVLEGTRIGDSIAVNGICLTVISMGPDTFTADVMHETLNRTGLSGLGPGSPVNLERAMPADGRFGGHIVSGHIDGVGRITDVRRDDTAVWYTVEAAPELLRLVVEKGSIALDGISLTVAATGRNTFSVSIIPHTAAQTVLGRRKAGDLVTLETDIIGKYVEKLMGREPELKTQSAITREFLTRHGF